ncbi:Dihydrosphingosine 1-phosphate phosphatase [Cyphellophora attinorum]|uniref:Dihydrosphingosine 1-phosphate phosphatase n=1 Tax=Cyphellophora attinorum TaxID=1664694 RepID=A0A0N1NVA4_9EURO|nr:Dihydrosphingosine 1-phosphate phosphatase [Phialophora attinorum]KPI34423.1 Dihydrosphingosine 1-phosphate phosphatase [Phialophora attinorum]
MAKEHLDAGLRSLDHYKIRLPRWRYYVREKLLPIVRWETPYVAYLQDTLRSPFLDSYFAMTANLGTHTFFMIMLPILFWCGYTSLGRGMVYILAAGVYWSGFVKDMLCLPRPLSPPLQRITMSGSVALEYGFPSTHSANAVSVAIYSVYLLRTSSSAGTPFNTCLQAISYFYFFSIALGRLYCGMHGFFDVFCGTALGAVIAILQCEFSDAFDAYMFQDDVKRLVIFVLIILVLTRLHPEPADNCPCYDDSVAFNGVVGGVTIGCWHYATQTSFSWSEPSPATVPFSLEKMGWLVAVARIVLGVVIVFAWRAVMKPTLLKILPPLFRTIEHYGLTLPRRYFTPASQYKTVPSQRNDDNVIPSARDIPGLLRRRRAISVGPQSEADAYEAMAYREKQRRDSIHHQATLSPVAASPPSSPDRADGKGNRKRASSLEQFRQQMGMGADGLMKPAAEEEEEISNKATKASNDNDDREALQTNLDFANVVKPRVRYDVEVVTKLIVYCGIGWLAVEINPIVFEMVGLGLGVR